jgi:hypothetical protein
MRVMQRVSPWTSTLISTAVVFGLGLWLGCFEWFGGYAARQRAFIFGGVTLAIFRSLPWLRAHRLKWLKCFGALALSLLAFEVGIDLGQVLYVGPNSASEFGRLFVAAVNREL